MAIERRTMRGDAPKVGEAGKIEGRAIPFNAETTIGKAPWGFRERIDPGACNKSIKDGDIVLLDNHDSSKPLARMSAGTLSMRAEKDGAYFEADEPKTTYGQDACENIRNKNYGGMSFGFEVTKDAWTRGEGDELDLREIQEMRLVEISAVTFPAYSQTSASMRDAATAARERAPEDFRSVPDPAIDTSLPLDEQASLLISQYNELPEDQRAIVRAAITETPAVETAETEPDPSTRTDEARKDALRRANYRELSR